MSTEHEQSGVSPDGAPVLGIDMGTSRIRAAVASAQGVRGVVGIDAPFTSTVVESAGAWHCAPDPAAVADDQTVAVDRWKWALGRKHPDFDPAWIAADVLHHLLAATIRATSAPRFAVLAVPAVFDAGARTALSNASRQAGLIVQRVVSETSAVACDALSPHAEGMAVVFCAGAGHAEVSVLETGDRTLAVRARQSDRSLTGDAYVRGVTQWLLQDLFDKTSVDLRADAWTRQLMQRRVQTALERSTGPGDLRVALPLAWSERAAGANEWRIPQAVLARVGSFCVKHLEPLMEAALADAGVNPSQVRHVIVEGGLVRAPDVHAWLNDFWEREVSIAHPGAVALGAARLGAGMAALLPRWILRDEVSTDDLRAPTPAPTRAPTPVPSRAPTPVPTRPAMSVVTTVPARPRVSTRPAVPVLSPFAAPLVSRAPTPVPVAVSAAAVVPAPVTTSTPVTEPAPASRRPQTMVPAPAVTRAPTPLPVVEPPEMRGRVVTPLPVRNVVTPLPMMASDVDPNNRLAGVPSSIPPTQAPRVADQGTFRGVASVDEFRGLPVARAPRPEEQVSPALPTLLLLIASQREPAGVLTLTHGDDKVAITFADHGPVTYFAERKRMLRAFAWSHGRYSWAPGPGSVADLKQREPLASFLASGLREILMHLSDDAVRPSLAPWMPLSPTVPLERRRRVSRLALAENEVRFIDHGLDGSRDLGEMLHEGYLGRNTLTRLILLLDVFDCLAWAPPKVGEREHPKTKLLQRWQRMQSQNHFEVLGVHWSAAVDEILAAWYRVGAEFGPTGPWHAVDAQIAARVLSRCREAWDVLSDDHQRAAYRKTAYPTIDADLLGDLLEARKKSLAMHGDKRAAQQTARLIGEIAAPAR